jgi:trans-AT polyketide synthase/acyltransferase/oxidoreductase domain-containing protein
MKVALFSGQGSQEKGMGKDLFPQFPALVKEAGEVLGYSIEELCLENPQDRLVVTNFTQAAVFVVNSLHYLSVLRAGDSAFESAAGHSLGEYCALFAAGVFDFRTGLTLVKKRGELMARAQGGGMIAVIGLTERDIRSALDASGLTEIDIANYNSPNQFVLSGLRVNIEKAKRVMEAAGARMCVVLNVGGAFHSR